MKEERIMLEITISPPIGTKSQYYDSWDEIDEYGAKKHVVCLEGFDKEAIPTVEFCFYRHQGSLSEITRDTSDKRSKEEG